MSNMIAILESVGDERFGEALQREDPATRSAVREFLVEDHTRTKFPVTYKILVDAPAVKWPSVVAEEKSYIQSGGVPPNKKPWTH